MPYKNADINRVYQREWARKLSRSRHRRRTCMDCGTKDNLKYGLNLVLCNKCKSTRQTIHLVKPPEVKALNKIKKSTKLQMRRKFGLPTAFPIDDGIAFVWMGKLNEAIKLKLVSKEQTDNALMWLKEFNEKIQRGSK